MAPRPALRADVMARIQDMPEEGPVAPSVVPGRSRRCDVIDVTNAEAVAMSIEPEGGSAQPTDVVALAELG